MLELKFLSLSRRSYYIIFFRVIFLHFKFIAIFIFFSSFHNYKYIFDLLALNFYCGLALFPSKILRAVFKPSNFLSHTFSRQGIIFSNFLGLFFEVLSICKEKLLKMDFIAFLMFNNFVNFVGEDVGTLSKLFLSANNFRFFFQPILFFIFLYRNNKFL